MKMLGWIQEAIKRPGSLRRWIKRHLEEIKAFLGFNPFDKKGRIKLKALEKLREGIKSGKFKVSPRWRKRILQKINLAITLKKLNRRRRKR